MSPITITRALLTLRFPRVSGDEPLASSQSKLCSKFSPRERG